MNLNDLLSMTKCWKLWLLLALFIWYVYLFLLYRHNHPFNCIGQANVSINLASAIRLAQGSHIKIKFIKNQNLHVQVDGEPWLQPPCEIEIGHLNQVNMLKAANEEVEDEESFLDFEGTL